MTWGSEHILLLQRAQVLFPVPTLGSSQPPGTPEGPDASVLRGHLHSCEDARTYLHITKNKINYFLKIYVLVISALKKQDDGGTKSVGYIARNRPTGRNHSDHCQSQC